MPPCQRYLFALLPVALSIPASLPAAAQPPAAVYAATAPSSAARVKLRQYSGYLTDFAKSGDTEGVAMALAAGGNANMRNDDGETPMTCAAAQRWPKVVELLLRHGAKPNLANSSGELPLILALKNGDEESAIALLNHGANVNPKSSRETPLIAAGDNLHLLRLLLARGCHTNGTDGNGWTALAHAVQSGKGDVVKVLLQHHANINQQFGKLHQTALMAAVSAGQDRMVEQLVVAGANIDLADTEGETAASIAMQNGRPDLAARLSHNANFTTRPPARVSTTASPPPVSELIEAITAGDNAKVALLISQKVDVNGRDDDGNAPLLFAAKAENATVVRLLVDAGADPSKADEDGDLPLAIAAKRGMRDAVTCLLTHGAKVDGGSGTPPLIAAAQGRYPDIVRDLLVKGADVNALDDQGATALYYAAGNDDPALVRMLLDRSANPNVAAKTGETPLHQAASHGRPAIVPLLLAHGARLDAQDAAGHTPLDAADDGFHPITYRVLKQASAGRK